MSLEKLKNTYAEKGVALAFGAGISKGVGLPDWRKLLRAIAQACLGPEGGEIFDDLEEHGYSLPAIAGMIRASCREKDNFSHIVRTQLYSGFDFIRTALLISMPKHLQITSNGVKIKR